MAIPNLQNWYEAIENPVHLLTCPFYAEGMMLHSYPLTRNQTCGGVVHSLSSR
jgi:hypothetical protein